MPAYRMSYSMESIVQMTFVPKIQDSMNLRSFVQAQVCRLAPGHACVCLMRSCQERVKAVKFQPCDNLVGCNVVPVGSLKALWSQSDVASETASAGRPEPSPRTAHFSPALEAITGQEEEEDEAFSAPVEPPADPDVDAKGMTASMALEDLASEVEQETGSQQEVSTLQEPTAATPSADCVDGAQEPAAEDSSSAMQFTRSCAAASQWVRAKDFVAKHTERCAAFLS